jgi:hypothetical protein
MTNDEGISNDEVRKVGVCPAAAFVISASSFLRHSSLGIRHSPRSSFSRRSDFDLLVRLLRVDDDGLIRLSLHQLIFDLLVRL